MNDSVEFITKTKFSKHVESVVQSKKIGHMEAILILCEHYGIEPEDCKKYVSNVIKEKLQVEAQELNFFPKGNQLPI